MKNEYRITKYNPKFRNNLGHYLRDEWIDYSEIGKFFMDEEFTYEEYIKKENSYISVISFIIDKKKNKYIQIKNAAKDIRELDKNTSSSMKSIMSKIKNGAFIEVGDVPDLCRLILRGHIWAKIYTLSLFIHFGYDYYMYIGFTGRCSGLTRKVKECGLFIERFKSPYK